MILRAWRTQERLLGGDPQEPIVRPFDAGLPHARQGWRVCAALECAHVAWPHLRPPGALTPHISTPRRSNPATERRMYGPPPASQARLGRFPVFLHLTAALVMMIAPRSHSRHEPMRPGPIGARGI